MDTLDSQAAAALYRRYYPVIMSKCARMLSDRAEAEDVAQETFVRLWAAKGGLRDVAAVTGWVYRTSTHLAVERLRSSKRLVLEPAEGGDPREPETELHWRRQLARLGRTMPARELEVAILSRIDGLTQVEIAEVLGKSERSVRRLLAGFDRRAAGWER